jgi:hypothetical protein
MHRDVTLGVKNWHRLRAHIPIQHLVPGVQWVGGASPPRAFNALLQGSHLGPGDVVNVMERDDLFDLGGVVDVDGNSADPALGHSAGNVLSNQAELRLAVVPLQLARLGARNMAMDLGLLPVKLHIRPAHLF